MSFNNSQTLKFRIQIMMVFYTTINPDYDNNKIHPWKKANRMDQN